MFSKILGKIDKLLSLGDLGFPVEIYLKKELRSIKEDLENLQRLTIHHLDFVDGLERSIHQFLIGNKKEDLK